MNQGNALSVDLVEINQYSKGFTGILRLLVFATSTW